MKSVKIQCPAKINLTLKVLNRREDGFHNIESIMQTINLFDYLTISVGDFHTQRIILNGNSLEIPYNEKNLVYKAAKLFTEQCNIHKQKIEIYIDKSIPVSAGLAGGSTDAAGTLYGLNLLFGNILTTQKLHQLASQLGSDLNVCLNGGRVLAKGRGEIIEEQEFKPSVVNLIKPLNLGIPAKEAYTKFSQKINDAEALKNREKYINDLEWAVIDDYNELQFIKLKYPTSMMTGSGSTYFSLDKEFEENKGYWVKNGLEFINYGIKEV